MDKAKSTLNTSFLYQNSNFTAPSSIKENMYESPGKLQWTKTDPNTEIGSKNSVIS